MAARLRAGARPDFAVWGSVVPNLGWSNIAREIWLDAGLDATVPAYSVVLACASSLTAAISAGGMLSEGVRDLAIVGGVESLSRVQIGLNPSLSVWLKHFLQARSAGAKLETVKELHWSDVRLHIPAIVNRTTGKSMGEHTEETARAWAISREAQDAWALKGHQRVTAAQARGFFDDLIVSVGEVRHDTIPRADTSLEKLAKLPPAFDRTSGHGTLTAGQFIPRHRWRRRVLGGDTRRAWPPARSDAACPPGRLRAGLGRPARGRPADGAVLCHSAPVRPSRPALRRHRPVGNPRSLRGPGCWPMWRRWRTGRGLRAGPELRAISGRFHGKGPIPTAARSPSVTRSPPPGRAISASASRNFSPCRPAAAPWSASAPTAARAWWRCWNGREGRDGKGDYRRIAGFLNPCSLRAAFLASLMASNPASRPTTTRMKNCARVPSLAKAVLSRRYNPEIEDFREVLRHHDGGGWRTIHHGSSPDRGFRRRPETGFGRQVADSDQASGASAS